MMTVAQKIEAWKKLAADIANALANLEAHYAGLTPLGSPSEIATCRSELEFLACCTKASLSASKLTS
jgi:hypothetical protein